MTNRNSIEFKVWARHALFTDPLTRVGGEKCSYHLPTYEAPEGHRQVDLLEAHLHLGHR